MHIKVNYLENLRVQASFDDFNVLSDQPIRYKGDGSAPGPFDYFLASSVLCAGYFVRVYCKARNIPTNDIYISQDNIVDPENRYKQTFRINVELPAYISDKDKKGIIASIDRCTVKKTIQEGVNFVIESTERYGKDTNLVFKEFINKKAYTNIIGKDASLEDSIINLTNVLSNIGIKIEISSWRNPVPNVWSVHIRDADCPINYTNGKGSTKESALCSALGEFLERISNNYFYADYYLGEEISNGAFVHYPNEKWFKTKDSKLPEGILDPYLLDTYNPNGELSLENLIETNSGNANRGICAIPFNRVSDNETVYIPVNLVGNLFVSNGMSAGNSKYEARVQCLSEIFERAVKNKIISEELSLPDVPKEVLERYPKILEGIIELETRGYPIIVKDASLGGKYPVMNVTLLNPKTGGVFSSFGAHPKFEVALERSLTELLQGRSFEGLNEMPCPTFNSSAITEHNNIIDHFIDSTGVVSWRFFSSNSAYKFTDWNFSGKTRDEFNYLINILREEGLETYIADYDDLGFPACRILVPKFSEIYPVDDLLWDNNNQALSFRDRILKINDLSDDEVIKLVEDLEEEGHDDYKPVTELIGVAFDENSTWEELTIGELKCLSYLAIGEYEKAKVHAEEYAAFNDSKESRKKLYQLLNVLLDITLDEDLSIDHYFSSLKLMYGEETYAYARKIISGEVRFPDLENVDDDFSNVDRHKRLIDSYKKLINIRSKN